MNENEYIAKGKELGLNPSDLNNWSRAIIINAINTTPLPDGALIPFWLKTLQEPITMQNLPTNQQLDPLQNPDLLTFKIGDMDDPFNRRKPPFMLSLDGTIPIRCIVGASKTGKSMFLKTIITSCLRIFTNQAIQFIVIDGAGSSMADVANWGNVAGYGATSEPEITRRMLSEVLNIIESRQKYFQEHRINDVFKYFKNKPPTDPYGYIVLMIDDFGIMTNTKTDNNEIQAHIRKYKEYLIKIMDSGSKYGISVILTAEGKDAMGYEFGRFIYQERLIALQVSDAKNAIQNSATDFDLQGIVRRIPPLQPGRGVWFSNDRDAGDKRICYPMRVYLPVECAPRFKIKRKEVDTDIGASSALLAKAEAVEEMIIDPNEDYSEDINLYTSKLAALQTCPAPKVPVLPDTIEFSMLESSALIPYRDDPSILSHIPIGFEIETTNVITLSSSPYGYIVGDSRKGKTSTLATIMRAQSYLYTPQELQFIIVDPKMSFVKLIPEIQSYVTGYVNDPYEEKEITRPDGETTIITAIDYVARKVFKDLNGRELSGDDAIVKQAKYQETGEVWWDGPRYVWIIDDLGVFFKKSQDDVSVKGIFKELLPEFMRKQSGRSMGLEVYFSSESGDFSAAFNNPLRTIVDSNGTRIYLSCTVNVGSPIKDEFILKPKVRPLGEALVVSYEQGSMGWVTRLSKGI